MCCKEFLKRVAPFFLTFAVGLFIASFFVTIAAPNFQFPNRDRRKKHQQYDRQLELDIKRLREENTRLKENISKDFSTSTLKYAVPPPPPMPPMPPAPPVAREYRGHIEQ